MRNQNLIPVNLWSKAHCPQFPLQPLAQRAPGRQSQVQDRPALGATYTEALQVFPHPIAQLPLLEEATCPTVSLLSFQHLLQHEPGQSSQSSSLPRPCPACSPHLTPCPASSLLISSSPTSSPTCCSTPRPTPPPQLMPHPANIPFRQPPSFLPMPYPASSTFFWVFSCLCNPSSPFSSPVKWREATCPRSKLAWPLATGTPMLLSPAQSTAVTSACLAPHPAAQHPHPSPSTGPACLSRHHGVSRLCPSASRPSMPSMGVPCTPLSPRSWIAQSHGSSATVALPKFEEPSCKGTSVCGARCV